MCERTPGPTIAATARLRGYWADSWNGAGRVQAHHPARPPASPDLPEVTHPEGLDGSQTAPGPPVVLHSHLVERS